MNINGIEFDFTNNTYIMGILNVTPDSFSDGGTHNELEAAIEHAFKMIEDGATIIDIGGESTRPGFTAVDVDEEIRRTKPVIKKIREHSNVTISIDTTKAEVAIAAIEAGADIINDVSGLMLDDKMATAVRDLDAVCVLMHDGNYFPKASDEEVYIDKLIRELCEIADNAIEKGISRDKIILDPGVGFGKTLEQNLIIINHMDKICALPYPILLGCSRKSVIGNSLNLPVNERVEATITTSIVAADVNTAILRVHDVKENYRAVQMLKAIRGVK